MPNNAPTSVHWRKIKIFPIESIFPKNISRNNTQQLITQLDLKLTQRRLESGPVVESLQALKPFIRFYQFFGFLPISMNSRSAGLWVKRRNYLWLFTTLSFCIQTVMIAKSALEFIRGSSHKSSDQSSISAFYVTSINSMTYYIHTFLMFTIMVRRIHLLPSFVESCRRVEQLCKRYEPNADNLVRNCWLLFTVFMSSQILANSLYYYSLAVRNNSTSIQEFSDIYELEEEKYYDTGILYSILELYCDCGWTFGDFLISLLAIIQTRYFLRLNKGISVSAALTVEEVEKLRSDHRAIKDLVEQSNQIFSPIILINFIGNVTYLLTRLYTGVSEDFQSNKIIVRIEVIYAFTYQILKILIPTWLAAKLNETASEALDIVHDWPSLINHPETRTRMMVIHRFVSQIINDPVAFSACGYFTITKSFFVTLISGIMTYEVVILQFQQSGLTS